MRETSLDEFAGGDDGAVTDDTVEEASSERPADGSTDDGRHDADPADGRDDAGPSAGDGAESADVEAATGRSARGESADGGVGDTESGVTPAVSTFEWTPDGAACARCGETAARRWRNDEELVCSACKTW